jgi:hypothetical protein
LPIGLVGGFELPCFPVQHKKLPESLLRQYQYATASLQQLLQRLAARIVHRVKSF